MNALAPRRERLIRHVMQVRITSIGRAENLTSSASRSSHERGIRLRRGAGRKHAWDFDRPVDARVESERVLSYIDPTLRTVISGRGDLRHRCARECLHLLAAHSHGVQEIDGQSRHSYQPMRRACPSWRGCALPRHGVRLQSPRTRANDSCRPLRFATMGRRLSRTRIVRGSRLCPRPGDAATPTPRRAGAQLGIWRVFRRQTTDEPPATEVWLRALGVRARAAQSRSDQ